MLQEGGTGRKLTRRDLLKRTGLVVSGLLLNAGTGRAERPGRGDVGKHGGKEREPVELGWKSVGPDINRAEGEGRDGFRAIAVLPDGGKIGGTWGYGVWRTVGVDGKWERFGENTLGVVRQIVVLGDRSSDLQAFRDGGITAVMMCDDGMRIVKDDGWVEDYPVDGVGPVRKFQTACLVGPDLWVGGLGGAMRLSNWQRGDYGSAEGYFVKEKSGNMSIYDVPIMVRTIVADPGNPRVVYVGGWWGKSGSTRKGDGLEPGAGLWKTQNGGEDWVRVMKDKNVNSAWVHPDNSEIVVVGLEGAGDLKTRYPVEGHPSLLISYDGGDNWSELRPDPWVYDLVAPNQAFVWVKEFNMLVVSTWGGPVMGVVLPAESSEMVTKSLQWVTLGGSDRKDYVGGHVFLFEREGVLHLVTGGRDYWGEKVDHFRPMKEFSFAGLRIGESDDVELMGDSDEKGGSNGGK